MIRSFDGTPVDQDWLDELCAQALWAPTAGNSGGVRMHTIGPEFVADYFQVATDEEWRGSARRAPGLARAAARAIPARAIPSKGLPREAYDTLVVAELQRAGVELVCLAGFMRLLSPHFIAAFPQRILNIHPSLLPSFPGLEAQRQALEYGVKFSGCTVHLVDENLDAGPILAQAVVPIRDDDTDETLSARVLVEEHRIYTEAVRLILSGRYRIEGRRVIALPNQ